MELGRTVFEQIAYTSPFFSFGFPTTPLISIELSEAQRRKKWRPLRHKLASSPIWKFSRGASQRSCSSNESCSASSTSPNAPPLSCPSGNKHSLGKNLALFNQGFYRPYWPPYPRCSACNNPIEHKLLSWVSQNRVPILGSLLPATRVAAGQHTHLLLQQSQLRLRSTKVVGCVRSTTCIHEFFSQSE